MWSKIREQSRILPLISIPIYNGDEMTKKVKASIDLEGSNGSRNSLAVKEKWEGKQQDQASDTTWKITTLPEHSGVQKLHFVYSWELCHLDENGEEGFGDATYSAKIDQLHGNRCQQI